jgi:CheY-like chemotaxis protein
MGSQNGASAYPPNASDHVLVVDDDADIRYELVDALESEGYGALSAANGLEALEVLRILRKPPSVILLDLMMPVMDGWQFCVEQQQDPLLAKIPVIVVSAVPNVMEAASQVSATAYLKKPFLMKDLVATVGRLCSKRV